MTTLYQVKSVTKSCPALPNPMGCSMPGYPVHHQLPEFTQTLVHHIGDAIQPSNPLLSPSPPTFNLSHHQGLFIGHFFSPGGQKYWSFSFSISSSSEYSGLISFRVNWLDLLAVQEMLKSLSSTRVQKHQFSSTQLNSPW